MRSIPVPVLLLLAAALALPAHGAATDASASTELQTAVFAGGCFWCMEQAMEKVPGVTEVVSGYTGGHVANPSYQQVSIGGTGHLEAVRVRFDPAKVSYQALLDAFWHNVDPTDAGGQFCDRGASYQSAIFAQNDKQDRLAAASKSALQDNPVAPSPIVTEIRPATPFYPAEDYHQDYYKKNSLRYGYYKWSCGRAQRLEELWGKPAK